MASSEDPPIKIHFSKLELGNFKLKTISTILEIDRLKETSNCAS